MFAGNQKPSGTRAWGEIPRACATVFLAIYFTGLSLTVACNTSSGSSLLLGVVKGKLFSFWLVPPWLDLGFDYFFTYGQQADADHYLEIRKHADESWLRLSGPNANHRHSIRWQRLLRSVIASEEEAGREGLLAEGFSKAAFRICDSNDIDLRILVQPRPERQHPMDAPAPSVLYEARVRKVSGGDIQLIKSESRQEMAPVISGSSGA
ncbi:MAG: hypothetical protein ABGW75_09295 [Pirellulales bacterium]|jgi:hypothetical protein